MQVMPFNKNEKGTGMIDYNSLNNWLDRWGKQEQLTWIYDQQTYENLRQLSHERTDIKEIDTGKKGKV